MASYLKKKKVREALERAKKSEKHQPLSKEEVVEIYKEGISFGEKIKSFLKPSWFVKDIDVPSEKIAKKVSTVKRKKNALPAKIKIKKKKPEKVKSSKKRRVNKRKKK
ncbi:hypothetical protein JW851_01465 [Candidatus Woesearchaeota archaeon]|nr:hypothetical protein [Candidatus Woesearchaeota archaeon]